jgi:DnaK suppressor protein
MPHRDPYQTISHDNDKKGRIVSGLSEAGINEMNALLKRRLHELREAIKQELRQSDNERYVEIAGGVPDSGDQSTADLLADLNLAVIDHHIKQFREIEAALARVQEGTYGVCTDCGEDIELKRLWVYPTADRCRECQAHYEGSHVQPHRPTL